MTSNASSGFRVPYTVRVTPDKGRGVFADAPIRNGTIVWRFVRGQYAVYDESSLKKFLATLSRTGVVDELEHMFGAPEFPGYVIRVLDDGVLVNHSSQPAVAVNNGPGEDEIPYDTSPRSDASITSCMNSCFPVNKNRKRNQLSTM